jgi:hypothetical protein
MELACPELVEEVDAEDKLEERGRRENRNMMN